MRPRAHLDQEHVIATHRLKQNVRLFMLSIVCVAAETVPPRRLISFGVQKVRVGRAQMQAPRETAAQESARVGAPTELPWREGHGDSRLQ